ncbi:hypothetical protein [Sharpea porci]|uniref:hypothetical protein n=1 Tax=Sharpea porci TaxID=2652286 RepID=UPI002A90A739|nr:hypothetical protein [Sharpea porci]MDY5279459.1 hypothetical protein [Sharpea porci]
MLVDLVKDKHNNTYAYERVINTVTKGAVVVVVKNKTNMYYLDNIAIVWEKNSGASLEGMAK